MINPERLGAAIGFVPPLRGSSFPLRWPIAYAMG